MTSFKDSSILDDRVGIVSVSEGTVLGKEGSTKNRLFFIVSGLIYATQKELDGKDV